MFPDLTLFPRYFSVDPIRLIVVVVVFFTLTDRASPIIVHPTINLNSPIYLITVLISNTKNTLEFYFCSAWIFTSVSVYLHVDLNSPIYLITVLISNTKNTLEFYFCSAWIFTSVSVYLHVDCRYGITVDLSPILYR